MSLRSRLALALGVVALMLVAASVLVVRTTETYLINQVDAQLAGVAGRFFFGPLDGPPAGTPGERADKAKMPQGDETRQPSPLYVGVMADDGSVETIYSPNLAHADQAPPVFDATEVIEATESGEPFTTGSTGKGRYRVKASTNMAIGATVIVALPLDDTDSAIARLVAVEAIATAVALGVLSLVAWWVIRLGVRPIKQMADSAAAIADGDLSVRVPEGDPNTEVGELGVALNMMMGRIEDAFKERARSEERLRQFVADASHELRTPVTTIRGYADLYRHGGLRDGEALDDAMRRTEQEATRMGALVDDMLQLARLDQGRGVEFTQVDLAALTHDALADARATDPDRSITIDVDGPVFVSGDGDRLRQVLANLVSNAFVHTPDQTPVELRCRVEGDIAVLEVHDDGPGISDAVAKRAFERFFRGDPSRSRSRGGSGLGLAIVQGIIEAHGGEISLQSEVGEGTTVRVTLPVYGSPNTWRNHGDSADRDIRLKNRETQ